MVVVENVDEIALEFQCDLFGNVHVFPHTEIHVPVGQSVEISSVASVYAKNRIAVESICSRRVLENADRQTTGAYTIRTAENKSRSFQSKESIFWIPMAANSESVDFEWRPGCPSAEATAKASGGMEVPQGCDVNHIVVS